MVDVAIQSGRLDPSAQRLACGLWILQHLVHRGGSLVRYGTGVDGGLDGRNEPGLVVLSLRHGDGRTMNRWCIATGCLQEALDLPPGLFRLPGDIESLQHMHAD